MSLIDRYVYAVTRHLPEKQKSDIERELKTLIDDMLEQHQQDGTNDDNIKKVLYELGDPSKLADNYRDSKRYLIGPQNFDNYLFVLKIVLSAVFLGITIATMVGSIFGIQAGIGGIFASYLATLFSALFQGFAWVTISFAIAEYKGIKLEDAKKGKDGWSLSELPELPQKGAEISRGETIFSILFSTLFISILFFAPHVFAAYINNGSGEVITIPVFNIEGLRQLSVMLIALFVLEVIKEAIKLYFGRWNLRLAILLAVISLVLGSISLAIFANPNTWNANFAMDMTKHLDFEFGGLSIWGSLSTTVAAIIIFSTILDIATNLYKGFKYGK